MNNIRTSTTHPLRVDFIPPEQLVLPGRLGMTFAPGKKQQDAATGIWDRDLDTDLERLRSEYRTDVLVSLMEEHEYSMLQIGAMRDRAVEFGIEVLWFPIRDGSCPSSIEPFGSAVDQILNDLRLGKTVVVHCKGGWGRTGLVAAACLLAAATELSPDEAIAIVRQARAGTVENDHQEQFVRQFARRRGV